ncbi:MAG: TssQ family T6SS-associated lipoprotein [Ignavibacteria bacterium]
MFARTLMTALTLLLVGCASMPNLLPSKGADALKAGIDEYADGSYPQATRSLQSALELGLSSREQAKAHKYLAFIGCVTGKTAVCRDEFGKALDADPAMELEPAEAGHPTWGPVFRSVKAKRPVKK